MSLMNMCVICVSGERFHVSCVMCVSGERLYVLHACVCVVCVAGEPLCRGGGDVFPAPPFDERTFGYRF